VPGAKAHVLAHVFKVVIDPFVGKVAYSACTRARSRRTRSSSSAAQARVQGRASVRDPAARTTSRPTRSFRGDIGAVTKVEDIEFDCVLHDSHDEDHIHLRPLEFPVPMHGIAVERRRRATSSGCSKVLHKLEMEDPCFKLERHATTNETVIRGLGELHMRRQARQTGAASTRWSSRLKPPKVPYRETITRVAEGHCRHKKQTGGAGSSARCSSGSSRCPGQGLRVRRQGERRRDPERLHPGGGEGRADGAGSG